ncbi:hypothetical protein MCOR02_008356 [Pyricularia oryzae]|uniref:GED domain-containing protein n=1 Tax=Pyricularia grisea TaxID=148305 RepID=A0ABQ8NN77_PYRGI|nr:hypothetical protein MCOR01_004364 [Pyricularia oryzae]KAI6299682.1 hypothetical protein MCOR33_004490 [Pyricularia grisea]KAH9431046.1 hypothetical protein MCOR02_008356 [Pyricularia oryzae]KAI6263557.1 hypothetical protein MCOR19_000194 [Pyricularia oryzae]KAI6331453.1 hypothetical protein MCOR30_004811 [Pyricularia oryzae]
MPQDEAPSELMAIDGLQSDDHRDLLNIIDSLRAQGVSQYVELPRIIVCGDQSVGKSSVLEAISGMSFPTKDNLCTRFATELILRRNVDKAVTVTVDKVANGILDRVINPTMELLEKSLRARVAEILKPYTEGHPITYNHYFTEEVQKLQRARRKKELEELLNSKRISNPFQDRSPGSVQSGGILGSAASPATKSFGNSTGDLVTVSISDVVSTFVSKSEANMEMFAAATALDYMLAYYKVALKEVVDNIGVLAIKDRFIQKLPDIFSPATVHGLTKDEIHSIAAESPEAAAERHRVTEKLKILHKGLRDLKRIDRRQF